MIRNDHLTRLSPAPFASCAWKAPLLTAALCAAAWCAWCSRGVSNAHAAAGTPSDLDGDGLSNARELVLGTMPDRADSDLDGFSDTEELARGSLPNRKASIPVTTGAAAAIVPVLLGSKVHATTFVYLPDGVAAGKKLNYLTSTTVGVVPAPLGWLFGGEKTRTSKASDGVGLVVVIDPVLNTQTVLIKNGFNLAVTVSDQGEYLSAAASNLVVAKHRIYELVSSELDRPDNAMQAEAASGLGLGGVYQPLLGNSQSAPLTEMQICSQATIITSVVNAVVTTEVVNAGCVPGDAYCAPGCLATIGTRTRMIDPAALIGH